VLQRIGKIITIDQYVGLLEENNLALLAISFI
jgi:hypothetical protein